MSPGLAGDEFVPAYTMKTLGSMMQILYQDMTGVNLDQNRHLLELYINVTERSLHLTDDVVMLSLNTQVPEEEALIFNTTSCYTEARHIFAHSNVEQFQSSGSIIHVPGGILSHLSPEQNVFQIVYITPVSPVFWGFVDHNPVDSEAVTATFTYPNQTVLNIKNLTSEDLISIGLSSNSVGAFTASKLSKRETSGSLPSIVIHEGESIHAMMHSSLDYENVILPPDDGVVTDLEIEKITENGSIHVQILAEVILDQVNITHVDLQPYLFVHALLGAGYTPSLDRYDAMLNLTWEKMIDIADHTAFTLYYLDK